MKFLCKTELFLIQLYSVGMVYDFTPETAVKLIAADKKKPIGALSFFTPVDEEAIKFVKSLIGEGIEPANVNQNSNENTNPPATSLSGSSENTGANTVKPVTRADLIAEARNLGIKAANFMNDEKLKQVIEAAKKAQTEPANVNQDNNENANLPDTPQE